MTEFRTECEGVVARLQGRIRHSLTGSAFAVGFIVAGLILKDDGALLLGAGFLTVTTVAALVYRQNLRQYEVES